MNENISQLHSHAAVSVQFSRGGSIRKGQPRHPWGWSILIQRGHIADCAFGFATLADAVTDFEVRGEDRVELLERELANVYKEPGKEPYDVNVRNSAYTGVGGCSLLEWCRGSHPEEIARMHERVVHPRDRARLVEVM